uniref:Large ribosomal subunit protein eL38 n=1 Tax=Wuchereria bancrofti TaxID=6293 RepID=A0AAF5PNM4_WUCBA
MPQEITEIKTFLNAIQRKDAKSIKIKRNRDDVKFKLRCNKQIAAKLEEILPESIEIEVK